MKLEDLDRIAELRTELHWAEVDLAAFRAIPEGELVRTFATSCRLTSGHYGGDRRVELMPVQRSVAISAAERERSKVVAELQRLGVEVGLDTSEGGNAYPAGQS